VPERLGGLIILFDESITRWQEVLGAGMRSKETIKGYRVTLNMLRKHLETKHNSKVYLEELKGSDIESFFNQRKTRGNTTATTETHQVRINAFFRYAHSQKWIPEDISKTMLKIKRKLSPREYLSPEEQELLNSNIKNPMMRIFFTTLYNTGLRLNEALTLEMNDVDMIKKEIFVRNGKGRKHRRIPISDKLYDILTGYLENIRTKRESDRFFATGHTGKLSEHYVTISLRQAVKTSGIKKRITCHVFRHSFASNLVKKKVNILVIQKLLGHADIATTAVYLHADDEDLRNAVNEV
jgi:integrase/recombinase XerD